MGGKRPDQYEPEIGIPNADERTRADEHLLDADKQRLTESRADLKNESMIPKSGKNPALAELQEVRARQAAETQTSEPDES